MTRYYYALAAICAFVLAPVLFVWFGLFNISAREPHWEITSWILKQVRDRSIVVRSRDEKLPHIDEQNLTQSEVDHFHGMCRLCHGAPSYQPNEFAKGLYPQPPDLASRNVQAKSDEEIYWTISNGIKMTGMPSFGETHNERTVVGMLKIVRTLPGMQQSEYKNMLSGRAAQDRSDAKDGSKARSASSTEDEHHH